ncbi:MAG: hypothetical protein KDD89_06560, partial [Anaerolineales bacterium]|nr:hypothetical protein [Anaerolineales bacterium]
MATTNPIYPYPMRNRNLAQTILIFVMFGISMAIFLLLAMRGRFWWGVGGALGSYLLLFWLTAPYLARADKQTDTPYTSEPIYPPQPPAPLAKAPVPTLSVTQDSGLPKPPTDIWLAEVTNKHGDAIYGNAKQYVPDLYYGRVAHGAVVQLLTLEPVWNQYEQPEIKVRVLSDPRAEAEAIGQFGTAVWLGVRNTSLAPHFDPKSTPTFDPEGLRRESERLWAHYEAYRAPEFIRQPPSFPKGVVIGAFGTAVYGYEQAYDSGAY